MGKEMKSHTRKTTYRGWIMNRHRYVTTYANGNREVMRTNSIGEIFIGLMKLGILACVVALWLPLAIYGGLAHRPVAQRWMRWWLG